MTKKICFGQRLKHMGTFGICLLSFLMMAGLTVCAFVFSANMNTNNKVAENIEFLQDKIWLNLLVLVGMLAFFWYLRPKLERVPVKLLKTWLTIWVVSVGLLWVFSALSYPTHDSRIVTQAGEACAKGDYSLLREDYFQYYPFQLGYVFYTELMMRLLPIKDFYLHIEAANIGFLAAGYWAILRFMETVFHKDRITRLTILLLALCAQPILFSTFVYGVIPGLCCALWAVAHTAAYLKSGKLKHGILACIFIALAVLMKQNYLIVLAAMAIVLALHFCGRPKWAHLGFLVLAVVMVLGLRSAVTFQYEKRANIEFGNGIPIVSWAAMGMNEGYTTSGWYNRDYTVKNFNQAGRQAEKASAASLQEIQERLRHFQKDKPYAIKFFLQKTLSQWNEPTYQSLWTNQVRGHYNNGPWGLAKFFSTTGEGIVKGYMGFYQQLVFFCTAVALWHGMRKKKLALVPLVILGGFLYHLVFEGKSQYIMPYFVMMVPLASYGLHLILEQVEAWRIKYKKIVRIPTQEVKKETAQV